ncbi:MAG: N-acetylmuramoyl-L-alanine amidase [Rickettsiales bacterium]|nr:MAG: N-acetylmuramoyl-L-alanine amidase [Rickettsiales bacterium]
MRINNNFPAPSYSSRVNTIKYVIIHFTEMEFDGALSRLTDPAAEVSAHYLIKEGGEVFQLVADENIAWHAGKSFWNGEESLNKTSIGIELDNLGNRAFDAEQIKACLELCGILQKKYDIPSFNFLGHSDIAPDRKIDPGIFFDWELFYKNGFGMGARSRRNLAEREQDLGTRRQDIAKSRQNLAKDEQGLEMGVFLSFGDVSEDVRSMQQRLQILGYKIDVTGIFDEQTNFVVRAFGAHYFPEILQEKGLAAYQKLDSKYDWYHGADAFLNELIRIYKTA